MKVNLKILALALVAAITLVGCGVDTEESSNLNDATTPGDEYSDKELYSISRASQRIGTNNIWEGSYGDYGFQFGEVDVSYLVVIAPTVKKRNGRYSCKIANVSTRSRGQTVYPKFVGQLPAYGGIQAYYRLNKGEGRPIDTVRVSITGNRWIQSNCPTHVHVVRGPFVPGESEEQ